MGELLVLVPQWRYYAFYTTQLTIVLLKRIEKKTLTLECNTLLHR
jgi:hypothetical protein